MLMPATANLSSRFGYTVESNSHYPDKKEMSQQWLLQQIQPRVQNGELASAFEQTFRGKLNIDTLVFFILLGLNA